MKGKRTKQRSRLMKPVVVGFVAVYLVIMLLSTYLVKVQFENDYDDTLKKTYQISSETFMIRRMIRRKRGTMKQSISGISRLQMFTFISGKNL